MGLELSKCEFRWLISLNFFPHIYKRNKLTWQTSSALAFSPVVAVLHDILMDVATTCFGTLLFSFFIYSRKSTSILPVQKQILRARIESVTFAYFNYALLLSIHRYDPLKRIR